MAVILEKGGEVHRIELKKGSGALPTDEINVSLDWSKHSRNVLGWFKKRVDIDLGCFVELRDGTLWCIDGLQFAHGYGGSRDRVTRQGCYTMPPYTWHNGDDRGKSSLSSENISINPLGLGEIKRILVYSFIYGGAASWKDTNAVVKVDVPGIETVEVKLNKQSTDLKFCAIAELELSDDSINVSKLEKFYKGHKDSAAAYGYNFDFSKGINA